VRFRTQGGAWINNIDVTHALKLFALPQYALLQRADGSLEFDIHGHHGSDLDAIGSALRELFGAGVRVQIVVHPEPCDKVVQYRSELADGAVG
jgi:phenylacetate-CoA ligase